MVASRTKSKSKSGEIKNHLYYSCGVFRSKGSSVCSANSIRKQEAEEEVMNRLAQVLSKDSIGQNKPPTLNPNNTASSGDRTH